MKHLYLIYTFFGNLKVVGYTHKEAYDEAYNLTNVTDSDSPYQFIAGINIDVPFAIGNAIMAFNSVLDKCYYTPIRLNIEENNTATIKLEKNQFVDCFTIQPSEDFYKLIRNFFFDIGFDVTFNNNRTVIFFNKREDADG